MEPRVGPWGPGPLGIWALGINGIGDPWPLGTRALGAWGPWAHIFSIRVYTSNFNNLVVIVLLLAQIESKPLENYSRTHSVRSPKSHAVWRNLTVEYSFAYNFILEALKSKSEAIFELSLKH